MEANLSDAASTNFERRKKLKAVGKVLKEISTNSLNRLMIQKSSPVQIHLHLFCTMTTL
jgi:hypothetical protein